MRPEDLLARLEAGYEYDPMYGQLCNERDQLKAENAKLRELCKAWRKFAYELFDEFIGEPEMSDDFMTLEDRMCELGIEVPR